MDLYVDKKTTCCFTGHRTLPVSDVTTIARRTADRIRSLITEQKVRTFIVGGAIGFDTLAAKILLRIRDEEYPHIRIILYYPFEGYDSLWKASNRADAARLFGKFDDTVCTDMAGIAIREKYLLRDRRMVDESAFCIAYCVHASGGSAYTVRYAQKNGLKVYNLGQTATDGSV